MDFQYPGDAAKCSCWQSRGGQAQRGMCSSQSLQLAVCQDSMPELLALSPSHGSAAGLPEQCLVGEVGFCRFSLIFTIHVTCLGLVVCTHTMTIRGGKKRMVKFVELHIWASSTGKMEVCFFSLENWGVNFFKNTHTEVLLGFLGYIIENIKLKLFQRSFPQKHQAELNFFN